MSFIVQSADIDDRVGRLIHEINLGKRSVDVRRLVAHVLRRRESDGTWSIPPRNWDREVNALFQYVIDNVRYTLDPIDLELFQSPARTLQMGIGDCDDVSILLGALLQHAGYPVRIRVIGMKGAQTFSHVYLKVGLPPNQPFRWIPLDASREDKPAGWEYPIEKVGLQREYDVTDQALEA